MESQTMFLDCPAYLDEVGLVRCGLPAEVRRRFIMRSTDGPLESVMIRCPAGHFFNAPIEFLKIDEHPGTAPGRPAQDRPRQAQPAANRTARPLTPRRDAETAGTKDQASRPQAAGPRRSRRMLPGAVQATAVARECLRGAGAARDACMRGRAGR